MDTPSLLFALTNLTCIMPETAGNENENLRNDRGSERQNEQQNERPPRRLTLMTVIQVVAIITALIFAAYNNALIDALPDQTTPEAQGQLLVESEPFAPLAPCNEGGVRLTTGTDVNGNGVLETGEAQASTVVCNGLRGLSGPQGQPGLNGEDALTSLLFSEALPVGNATCPAGGTTFTAGEDLDIDGQLNEAETTTNITLCNGLVGLNGADGLPGADGLTGASALVDKVLAPRYVCLDGFIVRFGVDNGRGEGTANNGVLEVDEVDETLNFCFSPLRSERITDILQGAGNSASNGCEAGSWLNDRGLFVFAATNGSSGCELFAHDGEANATEMVVDLHPNGDASPGRDLGIHALPGGHGAVFDATDGVDGRQLWFTDGTATGTRALGSVEMEPPVAWNNGLLFHSPTGDLLWTNGSELRPWTDQPQWNASQRNGLGTAMSSWSQLGAAWLHGGSQGLWLSATDALGEVEPVFVAMDASVTSWDVNPTGSASLTHLLDDGTDLYAVGVRGAVKQVLHLSANGSMQWLTAIAPSSGDTSMGEGMGLHRIGDNLVYDAVVSSNEARVWTTNLANGITVQLSTELLAPGAQVGVANNGERLLFDCITATRGTELCVTDATPLGTRVLHEFVPGALPADLRGIRTIGDGWLVVADGEVDGAPVGTSLWTVQGDTVRMVYNPRPGPSTSSEALTYGDLIVAPEVAFVLANDGTSGHEWHRWSHGELSDDWIVIHR